MTVKKAVKKVAKPLLAKGKAVVSSAYTGAGGGRGWLRKKTTIKRLKNREVIEEKQVNFTVGDVAWGTAGAVVGTAFLIAAWGVYKWFNAGMSPWDEYKLWRLRQKKEEDLTPEEKDLKDKLAIIEGLALFPP